MRDRFKKVLAAVHNSEEYVVRGDTIGREGHEEVHGDVDKAIEDHRSLLKEDQSCVEQIINVKDLDGSNDAHCDCNLCKPKCNAMKNRIIKHIFG